MKKQIIFSVFIILVVSYMYFFVEGIGYSKTVMLPEGLFEEMQLKVALKDGNVKLFALTKNNPLSMMRTTEGKPVPEEDSIVIGYSEAMMMKEEKLFQKAGDKIDGFFGVNTKVEGVLGKTSSMIDDFHFLSKAQYGNIQGDEVAFVKLKEGMPKLFYIYGQGDSILRQEMLETGSLSDFKKIQKNGKYYSPLIIGKSEAEMMIGEKLFSSVGDTIDGFFGKDVVIVGILKQQNSAADMMHFSQFKESDLQ